MSKTKEMMSYIKQFIAMSKGDDAEALAIKVQRSGSSALNARLHNEEGNLFQLEEALERAEENLVMARMNNLAPINDRNDYVSTIIHARNRVTEAQDALEAKKLLISVLREEIALLDK